MLIKGLLNAGVAIIALATYNKIAAADIAPAAALHQIAERSGPTAPI